MSTDCKQASNLRQPSETLRDDVKQLAISRQCFFCDYCGAYLGHKITQAHFDTSRHISTHVRHIGVDWSTHGRHIGVDWSTHMCRKCVEHVSKCVDRCRRVDTYVSIGRHIVDTYVSIGRHLCVDRSTPMCRTGVDQSTHMCRTCVEMCRSVSRCVELWLQLLG